MACPPPSIDTSLPYLYNYETITGVLPKLGDWRLPLPGVIEPRNLIC